MATLALEIRDAEFIRRVGTAGLDDRVRVRLIPAGRIGIDPSRTWEFAWEAAPGDAETWGRGGITATVQPTGGRMTVELAFPWEAVMGFDASHARRQAGRDAWGDVAVDLVLTDDQGECSPFTPRHDPYAYPRIRFDPKKR
jgi:hypothetical protein